MMASYFFNFRCSYIGIVLFYCIFGYLHVISLTFVVLRQTMGVTEIAITSLAMHAKQSDLLPARETSRLVGLLMRYRQRHFRDLKLAGL